MEGNYSYSQQFFETFFFFHRMSIRYTSLICSLTLKARDWREYKKLRIKKLKMEIKALEKGVRINLETAESHGWNCN